MRVPLLRRLLLSLVAAVPLLDAASGFGTPFQAQAPGGGLAQRNLVLQGGQWYLGVDGVVAAARAELPLDRDGRWLLVPGVTYAHYTLNSLEPHIDLFAPEALVHLQLVRGASVPT